MKTIYAFAPITKTEKTDDGVLHVYGKACGPELDADLQTCDPEWLKSAMPEWFDTGANIREMHRPSAVGVGTELEQFDNGDHWIGGKIVDPVAITKTEHKVYTGFSIGINHPKIVKSPDAPNGRIVGGEIIEVSLCDRPANGSAKLVLAKMVGGALAQVEEPADTTRASFKALWAQLTKDVTDVTGGDGVTLDTGDVDEAAELDWLQIARDALAQWLASEAAEVAAGTGGTYVVRLLANLLSDLEWAAQVDAGDDVAAAMNAMKSALISPRTEEEPVHLSTVTKLVKAATADGASDTDKADVAELRKALGIDDLDTKIDTVKTEVATAEDLTKIAARLTKVEETVVDAGVTRAVPTRTDQPSEAHKVTLAKADEYDLLAKTVSNDNPTLAQGYRELAANLRSNKE